MERALILLNLIALAHCRLLDLSCSDIRSFVDGHNFRRLQLAKGEVPNQPSASKMKYIMWDNELAAKAGEWASRNKFQHNPNRKIPSNRFNTGENLYMYSTTDRNFKFDPNLALESWFDEYKDYNYGPLKPSDFDGSSGVQIGHYTQMAWWNTIYVGCAVSQKFDNGWNKFLVVCNYGPSGNYLNETPYPAESRSNQLTCGTQDCSRPYGRCS